MSVAFAILSIFFLSLVGCNSDESQKVDQKNWQLVWSDEFEGASGTLPDATKWTYDLGNNNGWGNQELETYTNNPENVSLDGNGNLVITARKNGNTFTSARIKTKNLFAQTYGRYEARLKTPYGPGIWPAFWLFGGNPNEEIDFFEGKGDRPNQMHLDVHCPDGCGNYKHGFLKLQKGWGAWVKINENFANKWNIISGEWQPGYIKFYLNGTPIAIMEREFKTFQQLYLNTSVAKDKEAFNPGPNETTNWPNSFLVDYVRVWGDKDTLGKMDDSYKLFENSINTVSDANLYEAEPKGKINYMYPKKMLNTEIGTITLLKVSQKKFSLSIVGKNLGALNVNVFDLKNKKVTSFILQNTEYSILDLSNIETGTYKLEILISNHVLSQEITILNP